METTMDNLTMGGLIMGGAFVMNGVLAIYHYETESDKAKISIPIAFILLTVSFSLLSLSGHISTSAARIFALFLSVSTIAMISSKIVAVGEVRTMPISMFITVIIIFYIALCLTPFIAPFIM